MRTLTVPSQAYCDASLHTFTIASASSNLRCTFIAEPIRQHRPLRQQCDHPGGLSKAAAAQDPHPQQQQDNTHFQTSGRWPASLVSFLDKNYMLRFFDAALHACDACITPPFTVLCRRDRSLMQGLCLAESIPNLVQLVLTNNRLKNLAVRLPILCMTSCWQIVAQYCEAL